MPADTEHLNIYLMYARNENRCGFWVRRDSWSRNVARITSIGGKSEGPLEGDPPYFKNQKVKGDVYWITGGSSGRNQDITSPGTYGYTLIDPPYWWCDE